MQQWAVYFFSASLYMFRVSSHPSSGVHKTVTTASGTGRIIGVATATEVATLMIRPVPEAVVTVLCTPDDGCDDTRNM